MSHPSQIFIAPYHQPTLCFSSTTAPRCQPISRPAKLPLVVRVVLDLCSSAIPRLDLPCPLNLPQVLINTLHTVHNRQLSEAMSLFYDTFDPGSGVPSRPQGRWGRSQDPNSTGIVIGVRSIHFGSLEGVTESRPQTVPDNYYPSKTRTCQTHSLSRAACCDRVTIEYDRATMCKNSSDSGPSLSLSMLSG